METGKYEKALMTFINSSPKDWIPIEVELITASRHIDELTNDIIRDSKLLAKNFTRVAEEMETFGSSFEYTGTQMILDVASNKTKLEVHKTYLKNILAVSFGKIITQRFLSLLQT